MPACKDAGQAGGRGWASARNSGLLGAGAIERLGQLACNQDAKVSKQALSVLAALAKGSPEHARAISACSVLDALPSCLQSQDDGVRKDAATLIQQVSCGVLSSHHPCLCCCAESSPARNPAKVLKLQLALQGPCLVWPLGH